MMNMLFLSGWGQPGASFPRTDSFDYMRYASLDEAFSALTDAPYDTVIGWSLGGQLAIRAIAACILKPRRLILIATPYRFSHPGFPTFYQGMEQAPERGLQRFAQMMCEGDSKRKAILHSMDKPLYHPHNHYLYWLNALGSFDCNSVNFSAFPPSLLIYGKNDTIVPLSQAALFLQHLPEAKLEVLDQAGHIPHLHDSEKIRTVIDAHTKAPY